MPAESMRLYASRVATSKKKAPKKRKRGRPSKLNPERVETICGAIKRGLSQKTAAQLAGISEATLQGWIAKGRQAPHGQYVEFLKKLEGARGEGEKELVDIIKAAVNANGDADWRAAAWLLERRWRDEYSRKAQEHRRAEAEIRKLEAEVNLAEAKAKLAGEQSKALGLGLWVDIDDDDGCGLADGITEDDVTAASPTPLDPGPAE